MLKKFKAHPLMIITFLKPFLIVLLFPIVNGVIQYIKYQTYDSILGAELFLFGIITAIAFFRWYSFSLICDTANKTVTVNKGLVFKRIATISVCKISSVQAERTPIDDIFRSVTYRINTEAGITARPDFEFKLSIKNSKTVSDLLYGKHETKTVKFSAIRIAILAATTSSAFTGIIIGVPLLNSAGKLLGVAISDMLFDEINNVSSKIQTYFPPVVNTISLIILIAYFFSFVYSFLKFVRFKLFLQDEKLEIHTGFFVRLRTAFTKSAINDIKVEQTLLMLLLRRFAMKVSVGGYGSNGKGEGELIIPLGDDSEIKRQLEDYFPFLTNKNDGIKATQTRVTESRFLFWPAIYLLVTVTAAIILSLLFSEFTRFIFFLTIVALVFIFYRAYLAIFEFRKGTVSLGDNIFCRSNKFLRTCEMYCPKERIGEIKLIRFPPDYLFYNTCRVRISVRSERADSIRVRILDYQKVKEEINKCFNIE